MWHQKKAHNINTQPDKFITCEHCGQSFQTLHKLSVHKSLKHKEILVTEFNIENPMNNHPVVGAVNVPTSEHLNEESRNLLNVPVAAFTASENLLQHAIEINPHGHKTD